jgi:hypothetical protein
VIIGSCLLKVSKPKDVREQNRREDEIRKVKIEQKPLLQNRKEYLAKEKRGGQRTIRIEPQSYLPIHLSFVQSSPPTNTQSTSSPPALKQRASTFPSHYTISSKSSHLALHLSSLHERTMHKSPYPATQGVLST